MSLPFSLAAALTTFLLILPAELPDKTMVATLVLSTRYRARPVWIGVTAAFAVQCLVAVVAGGLISRLPHRPVLAASAVLFAVGGVVLLRQDEQDMATEEEREVAAAARPTHSARRMALTSFGVLFAAEWGDLSQLLTAGLAARYGDPIGVFLGSWLALATIAGIAVLAGRSLLRVLPLDAVRRIAAGLFLVLAVLTGLEAAAVLG